MDNLKLVIPIRNNIVMESENNEQAKNFLNGHSSAVQSSWLLPFLRQLSIAIGLWTIYFLNGVLIGIPTVIVPQLRRELNGTFNEDITPWLYSVFGIGGTPWVFIIPVLLELLGRKFTFIVICITTFVGYLVFYFSSGEVQILVSEIILSVLVTASQTVMVVIITEYTAPQYRGIFLTIKSASFSWGIWVANAIGTYLHWKNIGIMSFVCCAYTISVAFWPESPYWLATKGKFTECAAAHRWLKGTSSESEEELAKLIEYQKTKMKITPKNKYSLTSQFSKLKTFIFLPEFFKPISVCMVMTLQYYISGKLVCTMYAIEIIKRISDSEPAAYRAMLILDGLTVTSSYIGSISSKFLKRRTLLISTTSIAVLFLFILSLYLFLVKLCVLVENDLISISLLTVYSIAISSGCVILATSIIGELLPLNYKSWSILILAFFVNVSHFTALRSAPLIFRCFGMHGAFLFYGTGSLITLSLLYKYLPETKDKTLQQIAEYFKCTTTSVEEESQSFVNLSNMKL